MRKLVLLRHAHRNTFDVHDDNGLSEKGHAQAERALDLFRGRFPTVEAGDCRLLTSPKLRCRETISPIAESLGRETEVDARLVEGGSMETSAMFLARIRSVIDDWRGSSEPLWIVCSHGDWIPVAIEYLTGTRVEVPKAGWYEVRFDDGRVTDGKLFRCD